MNVNLIEWENYLFSNKFVENPSFTVSSFVSFGQLVHLLQCRSFTGSKVGSSFFVQSSSKRCIGPFPDAFLLSIVSPLHQHICWLKVCKVLFVQAAHASSWWKINSQNGLSLSMSSTPVATSVKTSRAKRRIREMVATWLARPMASLGYSEPARVNKIGPSLSSLAGS